MIAQQGYELSFIILYGHSRLDRPNEKFCLVKVRLPTHPPTLINVRKMVGYVDLKDILQNGINDPRNFVFYMIFDWLSVSFR